jgi:hypothetical protein
LPTSLAISRNGVSIGGLPLDHDDLEIDALLLGLGHDLTQCRHVGGVRRRHAHPVVGHVGLHLIHVDIRRDVRRQERDHVRSGHTGTVRD